MPRRFLPVHLGEKARDAVLTQLREIFIKNLLPEHGQDVIPVGIWII